MVTKFDQILFTDSDYVTEYENDLVHLEKDYKHIRGDLEQAFKVLKNDPSRCDVKRISGLGTKFPIYKARKLFSSDLRDYHRLRLIYAHDLSMKGIFLIQVYVKGRDDNEDKNRILRYFST
jgi:hypothetical protein